MNIISQCLCWQDPGMSTAPGLSPPLHRPSTFHQNESRIHLILRTFCLHPQSQGAQHSFLLPILTAFPPFYILTPLGLITISPLSLSMSVTTRSPRLPGPTWSLITTRLRTSPNLSPSSSFPNPWNSPTVPSGIHESSPTSLFITTPLVQPTIISCLYYCNSFWPIWFPPLLSVIYPREISQNNPSKICLNVIALLKTRQ